MSTAELVLSRFPRHLDADVPGKVIGEVVAGLATAAEAQLGQLGQVRRARRLGELDQLADLARLVALHGAGSSILDALNRRVREAAGDLDFDTWLAVARQMVADLIVVQRDESGTVAGLLAATAAYLGLAVTDLDHDAGGYWHLARCQDRLVPVTGGAPTERLLALEENPPRLADLGPTPFGHGARFSVVRQGFDPVPATVIVQGVGDRTVRPMVVNVDDGFGFVSTLAVGDGSRLTFERDGRIELDGASVASRCFTFRGAVFAAGDHPDDFRFESADAVPGSPAGDRRSVFAVTRPPADGFDPNPSLPHGDGLLPAVHLDRAETRFAVFVGAGTFAADLGDGGIVEGAPHPVAGRFDDSVFEPQAAPGGAPSFEIGFQWDEREAYAVKVWLPLDFADLDRDDEVAVGEVVRGQLDRHRPAGVHVYVEHADPRWTLGTGVIRDLDTGDALGVAVAGTESWADDTSQDGDGP
jgi:hypothetical protein